MQGTWVATCTICELVDKYLYVLWGTVVAGAAILSYYAVVAVLRRSSGAPTDPVRDLPLTPPPPTPPFPFLLASQSLWHCAEEQRRGDAMSNGVSITL